MMNQNDDIKKQIDSLKQKPTGSKSASVVRPASKLVKSAADYYKKFEEGNQVQSRAYKFIQESKNEGFKHEVEGTLLEFNPVSSKYKVRKITNKNQFVEAVKVSEKNAPKYMSLREQRVRAKFRKFSKNMVIEKNTMSREDGFFDGGGQAQTQTNSLPMKTEFTPLLSTPFYKQMYLYDYLLMHSQSFWAKNYSVLGKAIVDITRNFVLGTGYSTTIPDEGAQKAWEAFEERNQVAELARMACDELTSAGEIMTQKVPTPNGIMVKSIDPSTIWEIVTDPENIADVRYYHQQYMTQYQLYGDSKTPLTKYIINQIPADMVIHKRVNVTAYEKRGRSDLLPALIYCHYFEEYIQAKLLRTKLETNMYWDVEINGSDEDITNYINSTQSIVDLPPGSENVHNQNLKRTALTPTFSQVSNSEISKEIIGAAAMATSIPVTYLASYLTGGSTKAGALVATEPVAKKMQERRLVIEAWLHELFEIAMIDAGLDPNSEVEFHFPELIAEDRSKKIADVYMAKSEGTYSHERASNIIAKELNDTTYDFESEMEKIKEEKSQQSQDSSLFPPMDPVTKDGEDPEEKDQRSFDRSGTRQDNKTL